MRRMLGIGTCLEPLIIVAECSRTVLCNCVVLCCASERGGGRSKKKKKKKRGESVINWTCRGCLRTSDYR